MDRLTKLPVDFLEVLASFGEIKAVVMENDMNLEGHNFQNGKPSRACAIQLGCKN